MSKASKEYDEAKEKFHEQLKIQLGKAIEHIHELKEEIRQKDELILKLERKGY